MSNLRIAFAGDRDLAPVILQYMIEEGTKPLALLLPSSEDASHATALKALCPFLPIEAIYEGSHFRSQQGLDFLASLRLDYIICVHFPYIVPQQILELPQIGVLNLHPAYLPYNRGWHTPTWAILENVPIGATVHFMDVGLDSGDIILRRRLAVSPGDTANSLYQRIKNLEIEVFKEVWPQLIAQTYVRQRQDINQGTIHRRRDLFSPSIQRIDLEQHTLAEDLIQRLRALTTNRIDEAAYYEVAGMRYRVQVLITEDRGA